MRRLFRCLPVLAPLVILLTGAAHVRGRFGSAAAHARKLVIVELGRALQAPVEVGRVSGSLIGDVKLHDVVVGRDPKLPGGALFRARTITLGLKTREYLRGEVDPAQLITRVELDAPELLITHAADGYWNVQRWIRKRTEPRTVFGFAGRINVRGGRLHYHDDFLAPRAGAPMRLTMTELDGFAQFAGEAPVRFEAEGNVGDRLRRLRATGSLPIQGGGVSVTAQVTDGDAAYFARYFLVNENYRLEAGRAEGEVQLTFGRHEERVGRFSFAGDLRLRGGRAYARPLAPHNIEEINGPVRITGRHIALTGVHARLGKTTARVTGTFLALPQPQFDLEFNTPHAELPELLALARRLKPNLALATSLASNTAAAGQLRLTGNASDLVVSGEVRFGAATLKHHDYGVVTTLPFALRFGSPSFVQSNYHGELTGATFDLSNLASGRVSPHFAGVNLGRVASGAVRVTGFPRALEVHGQVRTPELELGAARLTNVSAQARYHNGLVEFTEARAQFGGGTLSGEAQLQLEVERPVLATKSRFDHVDLRALVPLLAGDLRAEGDVSGDFTARGTPQQLALVIKATAPLATLHWNNAQDSQTATASELKLELLGDYQREAREWTFTGGITGGAALVALPLTKSQRARVAAASAAEVRFEATGTIATGRARFLEGLVVAEQVAAMRSSAPLDQFVSKRLSFDFQLTPQQLELINLRGQLLDSNLRADVTVDREAAALAGQISADGLDLRRLGELFGMTGLEGHARLQADLGGTLEAPIVNAEAEALNLRTPWLDRVLRRALVRTSWAANRMALHEATAWSGGMRVTLDGELTELDFEKSNAQLQLSVALIGGDVQDLLKQAGLDFDAVGVVSARGVLAGTLQQPSMTGSLELARGRVQRLVIDRGNAELSFRAGEWRVAAASARIGDAHLEGSGSYLPATGLDGHWSLANAPAGLVGQILGVKTRLSGRLAASGAVQGKFPDESLTGGVTLSELRLEGQRFGDLTLAGAIDRKRATIEQATLRSNGHVRTLAGVIPFRRDEASLRLTLQLRNESLGQFVANVSSIERALAQEKVATESMRALLQSFRALPPPVTGSVSLEATLSGAAEQPQLTVHSLRVSNATVGGEPLPSVREAALRWDGAQLVVDRFVAERDEQHVEVREGSVWSAAEINASLKVSGLAVRTLRPWFGLDRTTEGQLSLFVSARGTAANPELHASIDASALRLPQLPIERIQARLAVADGALRIEQSELVLRRQGAADARSNLLNVTGTAAVKMQPLALDREGKLDLKVRAEPQTFSLDPRMVAGLQSAQGDLDGELTVTGSPARPRLDGGVNLRGAFIKLRSFASEVTGLDARVRLTVDEAGVNRVQIERATGKWRLGRPVARSFRDRSTLSVFLGEEETTLAPAPRSVDEEGKFEFGGSAQLDTARLLDWRAHQYDLHLQFDGGSWTAPRFSGIHRIAGKAQFTTTAPEKHRLTIASLTARDGMAVVSPHGPGKGRLHLGGTVDFERPKPGLGAGANERDPWRTTKLNLSGEAEQFQVNTPVVRAVLVGKLHLRNDELDGKPLLSGRVDVPIATLAGFSTTETPTPRLPDWPRLDVRVEAGTEVQVRNAAFEAQLSGGGTIKGTPDRPDASFNFIARHGLVRFPGATLRVTYGSTAVSIARDDAGNLTPQLNVNLRAQGQLDRSRVTLSVQGPMTLRAKRPVPYELQEEPPTMSRDALFTRLMGLPAQESGRVGEAREQLAGQHVLAMFQAPLVSELTGEFRRAFGLSVLDLDYRPGEPTAVRFGKELFGNMFVVYRKQVSGTTQLNTLRLEYRIRGRVLLGYQTDEREQSISLDAAIRF